MSLFKKSQLVLLILFITNALYAQKAIIRDTSYTLTTYPFSDPDPVARPGRFYPYFRFDGYTAKGTPKKWKVIELENQFINVCITPEIGGKVWGAFEKSTKFPFIYFNHVVKFRDVGMRGAWTSGGIEFNFGDIGHAPTVSTPVNYTTRTNPDGSVSCFIGASDWSDRTMWRVEINLQPDKAYFTTRSWWYNSTPLDQSYYSWTNAAFKSAGGLETVFPGTHYIGHVGESDSWPADSVGRQISWYDRNNFGSYKSYHVMGKPTDFYGGFWHDDNMGFGHWSPYQDKLGKKVWIWGLSREGMIWEPLLTDSDGQYVELQSGRLFNQATSGSINSPFKHVSFKPYTKDSWTEYWYPVKQTRGLTYSTPRGALNLRTEQGWLKWDWMALGKQGDSITISDPEKVIWSKSYALSPMSTVRDSVRWAGSVDAISFWIGNERLTEATKQTLSRPLHAPENFDWDSEYGSVLKGVDLMNQRNYADAEISLTKALAKNPYLVPALVQLAHIRYRQGLYSDGLTYIRKALSVNTYDPGANYLWGLLNEKEKKWADVKDGFSVAALDPGLRSAASLRLAILSAKQRLWTQAEREVNQCLQANPDNELAYALLQLIYRKTGRLDEIQRLIKERLTLDPLNPYALTEQALLTKTLTGQTKFTGMITQELPHELYLEVALHYVQLEQFEEALQILALAPVHPIVQVWQAYILKTLNKNQESLAVLTKAEQLSPDFVFPFRPETLPVLQWAQARSSSWKWLYYEGLIRWQLNQPETAKKLFMACNKQPDWAPFYWAKAQLFEKDTVTALDALTDGLNRAPESWRSGWLLTRYYLDHKSWEKALSLSEKMHRKHPESYIIAVQYARSLLTAERYGEALQVFKTTNLLPAEGAKDVHGLFREANIRYALAYMRNGNWKKALPLLVAAESWPEQLGSGEPYHPDNRLTKLLQLYCYDQLHKRAEAEKMRTSLFAEMNYKTMSQSVNYKQVVEDLARKTEKEDQSNLSSFSRLLK